MINEYNKQSIGRNIKNKRNAISMTQQKLADAVGVTIQTIQKYESAKVAMSFPLLVNIAEVLDCHVYDLIDMPYNLNQKRLAAALTEVEKVLQLTGQEKNIEVKTLLLGNYYALQAGKY